jgi:amino acid adenylation domain-containing protein
MVLLAAFWVLLRGHAEHPIVCVGTPVTNRSRPELADTVGLLLNTLPLTARIEQHATFADVVRHARTTVSEALTHQGLPFEQMVREVMPARDRSHAPLFDVLLSMRPPAPAPAWPGVSATWLEIPGIGAKYDLAVEVELTEDGLDVWFVYRDELYEPQTVARLADRYGALLAALVDDPGRLLGEVDALAADERTLVLDTWNGTAEPEGPSFDRRFAEQVRATPDAVAVRTETGELTYAELDRRVDVLAARLAGLPTGPEPVALVCCERGADLVVALLAALRAGVTYVPVAPGAPRTRTVSMLGGVDVVLTTRAAQPGLPAWQGPLLFVDDLDGTALPKADRVADPGQAAYVLYTSGSTGRPKGVTVTRRGFDNYVNWAARAYGHRPGEVSVVHTAISFDLTVTSLFPPLVTGGTLRLLPETAGVDELAAAVSDGCGVLKLTPAHLRALDLLGLPPAARARVRCLVVGGEVLQWADVDRWRGAETIVNEYGPTEAVVGSCVHVVGERIGATVPIGGPIANTRLYVLDDDLRPVGIGEPGELYIGGAGVARGYRDQPGLTAERYVPDPFSGPGGERLYRTGDVVRRRHDGTLEYLGRRDQQVQICGYRAEPAEIEAVLLAHPAVRQAAVMVVPG